MCPHVLKTLLYFISLLKFIHCVVCLSSCLLHVPFQLHLPYVILAKCPNCLCRELLISRYRTEGKCCVKNIFYTGKVSPLLLTQLLIHCVCAPQEAHRHHAFDIFYPAQPTHQLCLLHPFNHRLPGIGPVKKGN